MRQSVYINCWHRNQDDSAAMWALYGKSDCAVALTTTVGQLSDTLREADTEHEAWIARVEYVKHWSDPKLDISPPSASGSASARRPARPAVHLITRASSRTRPRPTSTKRKCG